MKKFWHYTVMHHLEKILENGKINLAKKGIERGESPVAWFSTNPNWEETVRKKLLDPETGNEEGPFSRDDLLRQGFIPVRIEVEPSSLKLRSWNNFKKNSGASTIMIKDLINSAKRWNANPKEWYVSYDEVPIDQCLINCELWNGKSWVEC